MTIVSRGYEGTIMPNVSWAEWQQASGHEYVASHYDAGRVSIVTSTPLTVRVNVGPTVNGLRTGIGGHGVFDAITVAENITFSDALPGAGQSKWYTVVARRTWQTTQATTFTALTGTASEAIAASRQQTPGTVDEQPLALVQVTNGTSGLSITAVRDLRPVSRNGVYVVDPPARDLVMSYFNQVGYQLRVGSTTWTRTVSGGSETWSPSESVGLPLAVGGGYGPFEGSPSATVSFDRAFASGGIVRTSSGGAFSAGVPFDIVTLPAEARPAIDKRVGVAATWSGPATVRYKASTGRLQLEYGTSGTMPAGQWFASLEGVSWAL